MVRVSPMLARGIALAAVLVCGGRLADPPPPADSPVPGLSRPDPERAIALVRSQDFVPLFDVAGRRIQALFPPEREQAFLDEVFSLAGKWKAVTRGRDSYARYVRKSFERLILAPAEVQAMLEQVRADHGYAVSAAENRLLIAYVEDLRPFRPELSFEDLRTEHAGLARTIGPLVVKDLAMNAVSIAGSEVAAAILVGTMTSTGLVAAGAAAGPWTFGASLVAGVLAGIVLDAILGDLAEDAARAEIHRHLQDFRNRIVDAVHDALARALLDWRRLEEACVREMYQGGHHGGIAAGPR
jgi:hypothetical protein